MNYQLLSEKYGTPLYLYDIDKIKKIITDYLNNFKSKFFSTEVLYASKAFCIKELLRIIETLGMSLDVVSLGELKTAEAVDFDYQKIYFHGNNKSHIELEYAVKNNVGYIVVDNFMELECLEMLAKKEEKKVKILIRLNVGIEAHTHKYIVTAHVDSKFGVLYNSKEYLEMFELIKKSKNIMFQGFHSHIGSQIFDLEAYGAAIDKLVSICKDFKEPLILNLGGGFGAKYTLADSPIDTITTCKYIINKVEDALVLNGVKLAKLCIEPGRSIVAEAGITLYKIGFIKQTVNKLYYFVDGGMTDNIRPALYQASYSADVVGKENDFKKNLVTVAGKCCESGDVIIENILLPEAVPGDLLITYTTGAYGYSMSSNYNKNLTPAVVFVEDGIDRLVVRRQSFEELLEREL